MYKHLLISHTNSFKYIGPIGKGGFGSVVKAVHILDNNFYAIKKIKLHLGVEQDIKEHKVFREVQTMIMVNNANVVRYYTCWVELADEDEQKREKKKIENSYKRYSHAFNKPKDMSQTNMPKPSRIDESDDDIEFKNVSAYGISKLEKSDSGIEWEHDDENNNVSNNSEANESDNIQFVSKRESNFDEESKKDVKNYQDYESSSGSSYYSSDSLDSVFDYTSCFDLLEKKKDFVTINLKIQMEICTGPTLKEYLEKRYQKKEIIDRKINFKFFKQIIEGIKHVHRQGIIHRDLKPANVFITGEGIIKIGDFGLARAIDKNDTKKISEVANAISTHFATSKKV